jgi:hypothetical protein
MAQFRTERRAEYFDPDGSHFRISQIAHLTLQHCSILPRMGKSRWEAGRTRGQRWVRLSKQPRLLSLVSQWVMLGATAFQKRARQRSASEGSEDGSGLMNVQPVISLLERRDNR